MIVACSARVLIGWNAYAGALMFVVAILVVVLYIDSAERRRVGCDGCRVEALGSQLPYIEHTCSKLRAKYRDRKGRLFMFGRKT